MAKLILDSLHPDLSRLCIEVFDATTTLRNLVPTHVCITHKDHFVIPGKFLQQVPEIYPVIRATFIVVPH